MGIPALFRWISQKYPKINSNVIEELPRKIDGQEIPIDSSLPNPNGVEIDNLYLDMNGIIHPCCHPEDKPAPETEEEMYIEIFKYIDRIFCMIRPRKLLYMAIDGVAPRAKMNQQRSRRFRASQEEEIKRKDEERIRLELGQAPLPKKDHFDSNCITPGTPFMEQLAICLRYYIIDRLNNDPGWKGIQVILSDASVPGEGEHKIMDFIRRQKALPKYDPNTSHVLYGLDADLIMLALATHEPNFYILREDVFVKQNKERACKICGQTGHDAFQCTGEKKEKVGQYDEQSVYIDRKPFIFVMLSVLREYLEVEMRIEDCPFEWSLERAIDDWVFMIFFVGNDFLPHLPSLDIKEGAIELLIGIWKEKAREWDGYLTDSGDIDLGRVQLIMEAIGKVEDTIFIQRRETEEKKRIARWEKKKEQRARAKGPSALQKNIDYLQSQLKVENFTPNQILEKNNERKRAYGSDKPPQTQPRFSHTNPSTADSNSQAAKKLKMQILSKKEDKNPEGGFSLFEFQAPARASEEPEPAVETTVVKAERLAVKNDNEIDLNEEEEEEVLESGDAGPNPATDAINDELTDENELVAEVVVEEEEEEEEVDSDAEAPFDDVRLWESGWKSRYYEKKFEVDLANQEFKNK